MKFKKKKDRIIRFKTIEEQSGWELINRLEKGEKVEDFDRFEWIRLRVKAYPSGIYRFKTIKEKNEDEFKRVMFSWDGLIKR